MTKVFISYRRQDADAFADAINDEFERRLGPTNVFLDVKGIDYGADFSAAIRERIKQASVVLVLIGANWLTAKDAAGAVRILKDDDWVRIEIEEALSQKKRVIPVLVRGAQMPDANDLPISIRNLASCNAFLLKNQLADIPRLGGVVDGRLSVAEPIVIMAFAASYAVAERAAQRAKANPFSNGDPELLGLASIAAQYYSGLGTAMYYGVLVLGVLMALRTRVGWRIEEMLRVSICAALGVSVGFLLAFPLNSLSASTSFILSLRLALWFLGLSVGIMYGLKTFASFSSISISNVATISLAIGVTALVGSILQSASTDALQSFKSLQGAYLRSAFWAPLVVIGSVLWRRLQSPTTRASFHEMLYVLIPVVIGMLLADAVAVSTSFVPYAADKVELAKAMQDKQAQDNAIFFAVLAGVATWRINRLLQVSRNDGSQ